MVVHTLADATGDGVRCWYRGRILVPLEVDTDLVVEGTSFVVRVIDVDVDEGSVEVEVAVAAVPREVTIETREYESLLAERDARAMGTPCGDTIVSATRTWQTTSYFRPTTRGFGGSEAPGVASPVVSWTVGGTAVSAGAGSVDVTTSDGVFTVQYELDAATAELVLIARGGERYTTDVTATAAEPGGGNPVTATMPFTPIGWTEGFSAADLIKLDRCMAERFQEVAIRPRDWLIPPEHPDRRRRTRRDRINERRLRVMISALGERHPTQAQDIARMVELRYGGIR